MEPNIENDLERYYNWAHMAQENSLAIDSYLTFACCYANAETMETYFCHEIKI